MLMRPREMVDPPWVFPARHMGRYHTWVYGGGGAQIPTRAPDDLDVALQRRPSSPAPEMHPTTWSGGFADAVYLAKIKPLLEGAPS